MTNTNTDANTEPAAEQATGQIGIIWNPSKTERDDLETALESAWKATQKNSEKPRAEVRWYDTDTSHSGSERAAEALAAGCEVLIAAGGDGTVREVAEHLALTAGDQGPAADLGIVPLGTGNLLARNLSVPLGSPRKAFERILTAEPASLDCGEVEVTLADGSSRTLVFTVMVGFGIDAHMIAETNDDLKSKAGWLAYVESLGRALTQAEVTPFTLRVDDGEPRDEAAHTLLIGNCGAVQGGVTLLPDAVPDDGLLDLLALRANSVGTWLDTMHNMVWENGILRAVTGDERATSSGSTEHLQARSIEIELSQPQRFEVDGDEVGEVTRVAVRVLPASLRVR